MCLCERERAWFTVCNLINGEKIHKRTSPCGTRINFMACGQMRIEKNTWIRTEWWRMWPKSSFSANNARLANQQMSFIATERYQSADRIFSMTRRYARYACSIDATIYRYKRLWTLDGCRERWGLREKERVREMTHRIQQYSFDYYYVLSVFYFIFIRRIWSVTTTCVSQ